MPLLLMTPAADPLVEGWRAEHDWAAAHGVAAHVTVRMPFLEPSEWDAIASEELSALLPVAVSLARLEDRPGALVILVEPDEGLRAITEVVGSLCPGLPRHKADHERPAYHLTVVRTKDREIRRRAAEALKPSLPVNVTGTAFVAACGSPESGLVHRVVATAESA